MGILFSFLTIIPLVLLTGCFGTQSAESSESEASLVPFSVTQSGENDPYGADIRATEGEPIAIWVNHVKSNRQEQFEQFLDAFLKGADEVVKTGKGEAPDLRAYRSVRLLKPAQAEEGGTYTYVFLADPYIEGANYDILAMLKKTYSDEEAHRIFGLFEESLARSQDGIMVQQSAY